MLELHLLGVTSFTVSELLRENQEKGGIIVQFSTRPLEASQRGWLRKFTRPPPGGLSGRLKRLS